MVDCIPRGRCCRVWRGEGGQWAWAETPADRVHVASRQAVSVDGGGEQSRRDRLGGQVAGFGRRFLLFGVPHLGDVGRLPHAAANVDGAALA